MTWSRSNVELHGESAREVTRAQAKTDILTKKCNLGSGHGHTVYALSSLARRRRYRSVLYLTAPPSPLLEPQVDLAVLALEDAELVPRPLEPRGDLEEARLDVVDVAVEHPAIQHPMREDDKAAGAEDAVDLDEEGVERGGRRRVPRPREARVDDVEARRREWERRKDVGLDAGTPRRPSSP